MTGYVIFNLLIRGGCLLGVLLSALVPQWLMEIIWLRKRFICVAFAIPIINFYALLPDGGMTQALSGHTLVSTVSGSLIALAIATAWLDYFRNN